MSTESNGIASSGAPRSRRSALARGAGALVLMALVAVACVESAPAGPVIPLIPGNAIAAVVVESPYKLFSACDGFWKGAQLDQMVGSALEDLLAKSVPNSDQAKQVLDFARPWAVAVLPTDTPGKVDAAIYIPYRTDPDAFLAGLLGTSSSLKVVAKAKGYAMLAEGQGAAFPTAKALDLKPLARYPAGSIKLWGDVGAIAALAKDGYKPIEDAMRGLVTDPSAAGSSESGAPALLSDPDKMLKAFADIGMSLLGQLKTADAAVVVDASGLTIRMGASTVAGSDLQKLLAKAGKGASALDWASQVDAESFYGLSWAMDPTAAADVYKTYLNPLLAALGMPKAAIDGIGAYQQKWMKSAGARNAMSFDFDIDAKALAGASGMDSDDPAAVAEFMKKAMSFDVDAVMEVKNEAGFRALMKGYADDPDLKAFMKAYADLFGLELAFTNEDKKDGSFSYGEIGMSFKMVDPAKLGAVGQQEEMNSMFQALGSMLKMRWTVSGGKCFVSTGDAAALKALAARKAAAKSIAADPSFAAFSKAIPQKPVMILSMSMKKLMAMVGDVMAASGVDGGAANQLAGLEGLGNWYGYLSVDAASSMELGYFIPASDIGALARFGIMLSSQAKSGGDA